MAFSQTTQYKSNDQASEIHRLLGKCLYYTDLDAVLTEYDMVESAGLQYTFNGGERITKALFDYKQGIAIDMPCKANEEAIKQQAHFASNEMKIPTPFFLVLTYLLEQHTIKMYYVLPANTVARKKLPDTEGRWMTLKTMSRFEHHLRNKKFDENEVIRQDKLLTKYGLPIGLTLGQLPDTIVKYDLPRINHNFLNSLK
jgi:hypothetical protein